MERTYHGSCHCGAVRFECGLDLAPDMRATWTGRWWKSTFQCNCTYCTKTRFWKVFVPAGAFQLRQGEDALSDYQFGERMIHHLFCARCGVTTFARGHLDEMGGDFYCVNIASLDNVTDEELVKVPVGFEDGRNDYWESSPAGTRHL